MPLSKRNEIREVTKLSDLTPGTVLEVSSGEMVQTTYGKSLLVRASYLDVKKGGKRVTVKIHIPPRFAADRREGRQNTDKVEKITARVMVYLGRKIGGEGKHDYCSVETVTPPSGTTVRKLADDLRKKTLSELEEHFKVSSLSSLPAGSVLVITELREMKFSSKSGVEDGEDRKMQSGIATYETIADGKNKCGEVFLPARYTNELRDCLPGVLVYKGRKSAKSGGREFFDCVVLDKAVRETMETVSTA